MFLGSGNTDVAIPLSQLAGIKEATALDLNACGKGHVRDGNFHENITYDSTKAEYEEAKQAVKNMARRANEMEEICTGGHGVGYGTKGALRQEVGDETIFFMGQLILIENPGKVLIGTPDSVRQ